MIKYQKMQQKFSALAGLIERQYQRSWSKPYKLPFAIRLANGPQHIFGGSDPAFSIILNDDSAVTAVSTLNKNIILDAYLEGSIQLEGDLMQILALRDLFNDNKGARFLWRFIRPI